MFGGITQLGYSAELFSFDPTTKSWSRPSTLGKGPTARAFCGMTTCNQSIIFYGG